MRNIVIIIIFLSSIELFSQMISVKSSIEWRKPETNKWRKYRLKKIPYLNITYSNPSKDSIYFKKVLSSFDISVFYIPCIPVKSKINFKELKSHNNEKFFINISNKYWSDYWDLLNEKEKANTASEVEVANNDINEDLHNIYKYLYKGYKVTEHPFVSATNENKIDITANNMLTKLRPYFIFLKPGENFTDSYDLTGFNILGGNFTFTLDFSIMDSVETTSSWDESQKKWVYKKEPLPSEVNGYKLYLGDIKSNETSINFDSIFSK